MTHVDCKGKVEQLLRTANTARMINEMSTLASMYTPMSIPPTKLPQYVLFDRTSQWHSSALFSVALESVTLPTRLRRSVRKGWFLDDLEAALNVNGNQRIAQLQCSILDPEDAPLMSAISYGSTDDARSSGNDDILNKEDGLQFVESRFDMDFMCSNTRSTSRIATQHNVSDHVFSAIETTRTKVERAKDKEMNEDNATDARKLRRLASLPVIERFVTAKLSHRVGGFLLSRLTPHRLHSSLEYPLLDSFPPIIPFSRDHNHLAVHTSLSTTSRISKRMKALQGVVKKMAKLDESEALSNGLCEISEAYEHVWHSGSDESDD